MLSTITKRLRKIEDEHNIKIVYACESGSRAGEYNSADSDYDIRFIYKRRPWTYQDLIVYDGAKKDTIAFMTESRGEKLDFHGWDLGFALKKVYEGNATVMEWLTSHPVYLQRSTAFTCRLRDIARMYFQRSRCANGYRARCLSYLGDNWESQPVFSCKAIANALFFALRARWCLVNKSFPRDPRLKHLAFWLAYDGNISKDLSSAIEAFVNNQVNAQEQNPIEMSVIFRDFFLEVQWQPKVHSPKNFYLPPNTINNLWRSEVGEELV